jgi:DNA cross-link repair 1A protein
MFLFYLKHTKQYILHTGDFRASEKVVMNPFLSNIKISVLYLDTTYCDSYYKFESQDKIIALGVQTVKAELKKYPKSIVVCGSYTIGKERVFVEIAKEIKSKIFVKRDKKRIIECLDDEFLSAQATLDPNETNLHVLPMGQMNLKDLACYLAGFPNYNRIIGIKPTGWTHTSDSGLTVDSKKDNTIIYGTFELLGNWK